MSIPPALPLSGLAGWQFLRRTLPEQQARFASGPMQEREAAHLRANLAGITSAEDLIADRRILRVALDAFDLGADMQSRALLRRVLSEGASDPDALANRLSDRRYRAIAETFAFDAPDGPRTSEPGFADRLLQAAATRRFEAAVGERDETLRLALSLQRDLPALAEEARSDRSRWFAIMGTPPLRKVFETAFGLPKAFAALDLDRQLGVLQERSRRAFGSAEVAQLADPARLEALTRRFLLRSEATTAQTTGPASAALQLLQAARPR